MGLGCLFSTPKSSPLSLGSECICYSSLCLDPDGKREQVKKEKTTTKLNKKEKDRGASERALGDSLVLVCSL